MSSTPFNVGLNENRNSSRVLKPPGGGHSDIFGIRDQEQDMTRATPSKNYPKSTIGEIFGTNGTDEEKSISVTAEEKTDGDVKPKAKENVPNEPSVKKENVSNEPSATVPQRVRVPPGGFSSGLW